MRANRDTCCRLRNAARRFVRRYFDDACTIVSTVVEVHEKSVRVEHCVRRGNEEVGRGFERRVYVLSEGTSFRSAAFPSDLREHLLRSANDMTVSDESTATP